MKRPGSSQNSRQLIRKVGFYSLVLMAAGIGVAVIGAALVALLLRFAGMPFLPTWGVLSGLIIIVALLAVAVRSRREP